MSRGIDGRLLTGVMALAVLAGCGGAPVSVQRPSNSSSPTDSSTPAGAASPDVSPGSVQASVAPALGASPGSTARPSGPATPAVRSSSSGATPPTSAGYNVNLSCRKPASSVATGVAAKGSHFLDFTATALDCSTFTLSKVITGHAAVINFFASWCAPCKDEAPDLEALYNEYHQSHGFNVVPVDTKDEAGDPTPFYSKYGYRFPGVWDDNEKIYNVYDKASYGVSTLPVLVWIKCDGTIDQVNIGSMTRADMEAEYKTITC